jgi:hypothetical protein
VATILGIYLAGPRQALALLAWTPRRKTLGWVIGEPLIGAASAGEHPGPAVGTTIAQTFPVPPPDEQPAQKFRSATAAEMANTIQCLRLWFSTAVEVHRSWRVWRAEVRRGASRCVGSAPPYAIRIKGVHEDSICQKHSRRGHSPPGTSGARKEPESIQFSRPSRGESPLARTITPRRCAYVPLCCTVSSATAW